MVCEFFDTDFTPSQGSTPNYQINNQGTPQLNKASSVDTFPDTKSKPSLIDRKKRLYELIQEDEQGEQEGMEQYAGNGKLKTNGKPENFKLDADQLPRSLNGTPYQSGTNSACSSHLPPNRDLKHHKEETVKSKQSYMLTLIQSTRFSNRMKKKKKSPAC
ncbi:uncharacterized protein LOC120112245 [Phoenix dactylifera]|uniref:Uncharacterized protein LOC120112245 n=1 Tax=Phoenix dactylifera TaxID=42345 RepID=A0A8B9AL18_PHODC|nr:uncharacterized protein LOC120112245 [Phoenix dactylifera]